MNKFPKLYAKDSKGKYRQWVIEVAVHPDGTATIATRHGQVGGKQQTDTKHVTSGVNVGKSNETTPAEQAYKQATRKWEGRTKSGYREDVTKIVTSNGCMLAHPYMAKKKHVVWPSLAQPKLDGMRLNATKVSETEIDYKSRGDKSVLTVSHLTPQLLKVMEIGETFDGELYIHGMPLQNILSLVKKYRPVETEKVQYWIYDILHPTQTFSQRYASLKLRLPEKGVIKVVKAWTVPSEASLEALFKEFVASGFEGVMIRNPQSLYAFGKRSTSLLKYKPFQDAEFKIVWAIAPTSGREKGCIIWVCDNGKGKRFNVRPKGSHADRRKLYQDFQANDSQFIGQELTVRYQVLTVDEIPQFPVGITIRDYE